MASNLAAMLAIAVLLSAAGCGHESVAGPPDATLIPQDDPAAATPAEPTVASGAEAAVEPTPDLPVPAESAASAGSDGYDEPGGEAADESAAEPPSTATEPPSTATEPPSTAAEPPALSHDLVAAPSAAATRPAGRAPTADRAPRRPGEPEKITFEDLFLNMPADIVFRPFMLSDRARELDGERVSIVGYMHAGVSGKGIKEFVLLRNTECKFGPGGQADHLAQVILRSGHTTEFKPDPLKVEGTMKIEPFQGKDGNTWSIYRLEDAVIRP